MAKRRSRIPFVQLSAETEQAAILSRLKDAIEGYPLAGAAAVRALITEGRSYAQTEEGRALRARLAGSDLARRGRLLFEALGLSALSEAPDEGAVLTELLEGVAATVAAPSLETTLSMLVLRAGRRDRQGSSR